MRSLHFKHFSQKNCHICGSRNIYSQTIYKENQLKIFIIKRALQWYLSIYLFFAVCTLLSRKPRGQEKSSKVLAHHILFWQLGSTLSDGSATRCWTCMHNGAHFHYTSHYWASWVVRAVTGILKQNKIYLYTLLLNVIISRTSCFYRANKVKFKVQKGRKQCLVARVRLPVASATYHRQQTTSDQCRQRSPFSHLCAPGPGKLKGVRTVKGAFICF